ncbi:MAG: hypothetical protein HY861_02650 [Chlamydiia bacterium]|nr:hypothetical protein [Chlamydiia bacterium]
MLILPPNFASKIGSKGPENRQKPNPLTVSKDLVIKYTLITLLLYLGILAADDTSPPIPLFTPPAGWECAVAKELSSYVRVGFLGKGSSNFRPSMNLATEEIDVSAKQYLKAVREIHLAEPNTTWRDLGKFMTEAGEARLTEITTKALWGDIKMLQLILVKGKHAYILTGASSKDDFLTFQKAFVQAFQSLSLIPHLLIVLSPEEKSQFETFFTSIDSETATMTPQLQEAKWVELQHKVLQGHENLGAYWQFLVLQEGRKKIYQNF